MKIGLEAVAGYLPGETLNVKEYYRYLEPELLKLPETERRILLDSAPETVHRLKDPSALEHMALSAAQKAIGEAGVSPGAIDGLLVTQTGGKQFMPLLAAYLQLNLGLRKSIVARNITDNNISVLSMMNLARLYICSGLCSRVLIVAASAQIGGKYGFGADLTEPWSMHLGDGAGAVIVSTENLICEFVGFHFETYAVTPRTTGTLNGDYGPVRMPRNRDLCFDAEMNETYGAYLLSFDPALREIAGGSTFLTDTLGRASAKAGIQAKDISHLITAHIGDLLDVWTRDLLAAGLNPDIMKHQQKSVGNTACADPLLDIAHFAKSGTFNGGELIALWIPCAGVQVAVIHLKWLGADR
jgi:3-oxoacyl-[acyl-carrier-protein] synthase III